MFAGKIVKNDATAAENIFDFKCAFFAAFSGHQLGAERDFHFRSRPDAFAFDLAENFLEKVHLSLLNPRSFGV